MFRRILQTARTARPTRVLAGGSALLLGAGVAHAQGPERLTAKDIKVGVEPLREADLGEPPTQRSAYNPETGEIDWDCPCLGGMAHGPCGEEFKAAFACFVYSKSDVKGSECIPKFQLMQDCFKKHPDVYADFQDDAGVDVSVDAAVQEGVAPKGAAPDHA